MAGFFKTASWTQRRFSSWLNVSRARRGIISTRLMILIVIGIPVLVILGLVLLFFTKGPRVFYYSVPGTGCVLNAMLKSDAQPLRRFAFRSLDIIEKSFDPRYFDAYLDICIKRDHEEAAAAFPNLISCVKENGEKLTLEKIRPILRKYREDPSFLFWSASFIMKVGTPEDVKSLENTYRAVLKNNPQYSDLSIFHVTHVLFELKPETAPYDRLVELELAPPNPHDLAKFAAHGNNSVMTALRAHFQWIQHTSDSSVKASYHRVVEDIRLADFLFYNSSPIAEGSKSGFFSDIDTLSTVQRRRYYELAYEYLMNLKEPGLTRFELPAQVALWLENPQAFIDARDEPYYEFIKKMKNSKWANWPNAWYEAKAVESSVMLYNFKTYGEVFQEILDERPEVEVRTRE